MQISNFSDKISNSNLSFVLRNFEMIILVPASDCIHANSSFIFSRDSITEYLSIAGKEHLSSSELDIS